MSHSNGMPVRQFISVFFLLICFTGYARDSILVVRPLTDGEYADKTFKDATKRLCGFDL